MRRVQPVCLCGTVLHRGACQNQRCEAYEPHGIFRVVAEADGQEHVLTLRLTNPDWAHTEAGQMIASESPVRVLAVERQGVA